ncbi:PREDICTED: uncharacterized protein LOC106128581 [Papilio xuthus]|uniref:Uncharacterized protein LOC106128581 n=1 Tax=Papilio xuthus TaxID=66420 RepID=A0AAJ6ZZD7_PAPXU|nr:PREDICTED: uncharacterized protein LOC106128581 [Papilio xuthus]
MSGKGTKKNKSRETFKSRSTDFDDYDLDLRLVTFTLYLEGESPGPGDCTFLIYFDDEFLLGEKWEDGHTIDTIVLPLNIEETGTDQEIIADRPLIFLLRGSSGKPSKDQDPFLNIDNRAGGNVDLYPIALGEKEVIVKVPLLIIHSGAPSGCTVNVHVSYNGSINNDKIPLTLTMIAAHCLPSSREGTAFLSGIGLDMIHDPISLKFGMSLSASSATKIVWGNASNAGHAADTQINVPSEDMFVPNDLIIDKSENSVYWNAMRRVLVDSTLLQERLNSNFNVEIAGVPKGGKIEVRGRYVAVVDAGVLLQPGQFGVTVCAKLMFYSADIIPESVGTILDLPPTSARGPAHENEPVTDEYGHEAFIVIRMDLIDPIVPKAKITSLFDLIGFPPPTGLKVAEDSLKILSPPEEPPLDKRRICKESGALLVHKELSNLAYKCTLQMNKSIKRTAANRLLLRVRSMLKQFTPTECSEMDYQDTITSQHSAARRAVTSSFAPQPPKVRPSPGLAASRSRAAGDARISNEHIERNLKISPNHPRVLLSKVLRLLEQRNESDAYNYLTVALNVHSKNRYLLWTYGGIQFDKGPEAIEVATAAFRIAVKGDKSDGTTSAIGWAALHALHHYHGNEHPAFVALKKMRKCFALPVEWKRCLKRWIDSSGEEETFWIPGVIDSRNPFLIAAAFFLCLRCFKLTERILQCVEDGCYERGTQNITKEKPGPGTYYVRAASLLLRLHMDVALEVVEKGIRLFGPCAILSQIRATCLGFARGWDGKCEKALLEANNDGAEPCPGLLLRAAIGGWKTDIMASLQRAARAHKIAPSAYTALTLGRIYGKLREEKLAERWAAAAVKAEPLLSDGWAFLALLAMYKRDVDKARALFRTAKEAGPVSADIVAEIEKVKKVVKVELLPEIMAKDLCLCDYY